MEEMVESELALVVEEEEDREEEPMAEAVEEGEEDMAMEEVEVLPEVLLLVVEDMVVMVDQVCASYHTIHKGLMKMNHTYKQVIALPPNGLSMR